MKPFPILILLIFSATAVAGHNVYRWVDEQGGIHYGDVRQPGGADTALEDPKSRGAKIETIAQGPDSAEEAASAESQPAEPDPYEGLDAKTRAFLQDIDARNKSAQQAAEKADAARAESDKKCASARQRKSYLENNTARRLGTKQADGSIARMSQQEFEARLESTQGEISKHCR